jgi:glycosyltransferase involved in cell wall biosynthesis
LFPFSQSKTAAATLDELMSWNDEDFIHGAYYTVLQRAPDAEGLSFYCSRLQGGVSKIQILGEIVDSPEGAANAVDIPGLREKVRLHKLSRVPLIGHFLVGSFFQSLTDSKWSPNRSTSDFNALLQFDDQRFVQSAYRMVLQRPPDPQGLDFYLSRLSNGVSKIQILGEVIDSQEAVSKAVKVLGWRAVVKLHKLSQLPLIGRLLISRTLADGKRRPQRIIDVKRSEVREVASGKRETKGLAPNILASDFFDPIWYLQRYPDVQAIAVDPIDHFAEHGALEGRSPSPYFNCEYYLNNNPDVRSARINPLTHYVEHGESEGRKPSRYFDPRWYASTYGKEANVNGSFLLHFVTHGGFSTNPSPFFDAIQYYRDNPDVMKTGANPLAHYLTFGLREGRRSVPTSQFRKSYAARMVRTNREIHLHDRVAVFVTYTPDGLLRSDIRHYLRALKENRIDVVLVVVSDQIRNYLPAEIESLCVTVLVRENAGFDFAAWSHALQAMPEIMKVDTLYILNDSMIGPVSGRDFQELLRKIDRSDADIVGLTSMDHLSLHIQSYFIAVKKRALSSYWFAQYVLDVVNLEDKDDVIEQYELTFTPRMRAKGFKCESIAKLSTDGRNICIFYWRDLLRSRIPFIKRSLVSGEHADKGRESVLAELKSRGYPIEDLDRRMPILTDATAMTIVHLRDRGEWIIRTSNVAGGRADAASHSVSHSLSDICTTFIGVHSYSNGLGAAARGYIASLMRTGLRYNIHSIRRPFHVHSKRAPDWIVNSFPGLADVALVHVNPDGKGSLLSEEDFAAIESARRRIGLFVWEASKLPAYWTQALNRMDAIIAPSEYCADIFRRHADVPVYVVPYAVPVPLATHVAQPSARYALRDKVGLRRDSRILLYAFDGSSFIARKNPAALVRAFKASHLSRSGWQLVLKTKHLFDVPEQGIGLRRIIDDDESITLINDPLARRDMDVLFDEAEIYASPHCSEGFGLTIAEAMARGKIVVATDFGGSRDFMDATCGFPVRATIISLKDNVGPYQAGGQWAVIDEEALATALSSAAIEATRQSMAGNDSMSARAVARIRKDLSYEAIAERLRTIVRQVHDDQQYSDRTQRLLSL